MSAVWLAEIYCHFLNFSLKSGHMHQWLKLVEITDVSLQTGDRPTLCADSMCPSHWACFWAAAHIGLVSSDQVELDEHFQKMITQLFAQQALCVEACSKALQLTSLGNRHFSKEWFVQDHTHFCEVLATYTSTCGGRRIRRLAGEWEHIKSSSIWHACSTTWSCLLLKMHM